MEATPAAQARVRPHYATLTHLLRSEHRPVLEALLLGSWLVVGGLTRPASVEIDNARSHKRKGKCYGLKQHKFRSRDGGRGRKERRRTDSSQTVLYVQDVGSENYTRCPWKRCAHIESVFSCSSSISALLNCDKARASAKKRRSDLGDDSQHQQTLTPCL